MLIFIKKLKIALKGQQKTSAIFVDLSKAFDACNKNTYYTNKTYNLGVKDTEL